VRTRPLRIPHLRSFADGQPTSRADLYEFTLIKILDQQQLYPPLPGCDWNIRRRKQ
jgi:hypothetical protein